MNRIGLMAASASITCLITTLIIFAVIFHNYGRAAHLPPSPLAISTYDSDGFPDIDWNYWIEINPDIIGWITIPDTNVDYPIVQASKNDPQFYLNHDVYRSWNYMGCPYLDASCIDGGVFESKNAVVFAHNLGYGDESLFAHIARYKDREFAQSHQAILLQTPRSKRKYFVQGIDLIHGSERAKRTVFENDSDFRSWLDNTMRNCSMTIRSPDLNANRILTLCTCSYNYWSDERTLLYAAPTN